MHFVVDYVRFTFCEVGEVDLAHDRANVNY